jgi:hypothetical protein
MKTILIQIVVIILFIVPSFAQSDSLFKVSEGVLTDSMRTAIKILQNKKSNLYEDENYVVRGTCSGEWGGTVILKSK